LRKVLSNLGWLLGSRGINAALSLIYLALATRSLGLSGFGRFALIVVMAQTIAGIASFSTWQAVVRWGQDENERREAVGFAVALDGLSLALGVPLSILAAWMAPYWLPLPADLRGAALGLSLAAVCALRSTPTGVLRLHDRFAWGAAAEAVQPAARAGGAVAAWLFLPSIVGFVVAWGVAELACAATHWALAARLETISRRDVSLRRLPRRHPEVWRFVFATNASRTLAVSAKQAVLLLVGACGGAALAGGFRVAAQLGQALVQLADAMARALYPELVRGGAAARSLVPRTVLLGGAVGLSAAVLAFAFGGWALTALAGRDFVMAQPALVLLALAGTAELIATSWDALLVSRGQAGVVFIARAIPFLLALAALPWTVARFGLSGAAMSILGASAVSSTTLGYLVLAARRTGLGASGISR
jgi:O-antigen/teichoic acid export membrane protein